jgi:hypothetical protein
MEENAGNNGVTESPEITETPSEQTTSEVNVDELLGELSKIGVTDTESLHGIVNASQQAGRTAQLLGEAREQANLANQRIQELTEKINSMKTDGDQWDDGSQPVDLTNLFSKTLETFWDKKTKEAQTVELNNMKEMMSIKSDPDYAVASKVWEAHISNPDVIAAIRSGHTSATVEYNKVARQVLRKIAMDSRTAIEGYTQKVDPPHMESSSTINPPTPTPDQQQTENIKNITKPENWSGTDNNIKDLVNIMIPRDDPFWQSG